MIKRIVTEKWYDYPLEFPEWSLKEQSRTADFLGKFLK